jgi:ATP-binding cassette subfamily B protein RaxB
VAAVALYGVLRWAFYDPLRAPPRSTSSTRAKQQSHFLETVRGVQSIKLFGARRSGGRDGSTSWSTR